MRAFADTTLRSRHVPDLRGVRMSVPVPDDMAPADMTKIIEWLNSCQKTIAQELPQEWELE